MRSVVLGEVASLRIADDAGRISDEHLLAKLDEWRKAEPNVGLAVDIMSAAVAVNRLDAAEQVAWWTLRFADELAPAIVQLAESCASPELRDTRWEQSQPTNAAQILARVRKSLRTVGPDAISLVDMAFAFVALGKKEAARRAIMGAVQLAPDNRFVLRAVARFWEHYGAPEIGREILLSSPRTANDPWLISAEVSLASRAGASPRLFKRGLQLLADRNLQPRHVSELAGAVGTQFVLEGKKTKARSHFQTSLQDPTENALAQAVWAERRDVELNVQLDEFGERRPEEARAWEARNQGEWPPALEAIERWLKDEPFSISASGLGVMVASMIHEDERTRDFAIRGAAANPQSAFCTINVAFAEALAGNFDRAEKALERSKSLKADGVNESQLANDVATAANHGLIMMRRGQLDAGRANYTEAIELAKKGLNQHLAATAAAFLAREEARLQSPLTGEATQQFVSLAKHSADPAFEYFRQELGVSPRGSLTLQQTMKGALERKRAARPATGESGNQTRAKLSKN